MSDTLTPIARLTRDIKLGALTLGDHEARYLVDAYYIIQDDRKRSKSQLNELSKAGEPNSVIEWLFDQNETLENQIKVALDHYTQAHPVGAFMRGTTGIGPVISAGLLAHIDITKAPTAGHIWQFAGIAGDNQRPWLKGEKRPFNATLKVLCYKAGDSFMKFSNHEKCYYGHTYKYRKNYEQYGNDEGKYVEQANVGAERVKKTTDAWPWYAGCYPAGTTKRFADCDGLKIKEVSSTKRTEIMNKWRLEFLRGVKREPGTGLPMLPPGHIDARARRYAVKLFLSHLHDEWYRIHFKKEPPLPYPIVHIPGHEHFVALPGPGYAA